MSNIRLLAALGSLALLLTGQGQAFGAPESVDLQLLGTTDVHAHVAPTDYFSDTDKPFGLAKLQTMIKRLRSENPNTLLLDSGDTFQGSPLADVYAKQGATLGVNPMIAAMNVMGYDALELGNHDFNYGLDYLRAAQQQAHFPFLAANVFDSRAEAFYTMSLFKPYVIREVAGVKVGILGFVPPGIMLWDRANLEGKAEVLGIVPSARHWIAELKKQGVDVVVALPHSGLGGKYGPAYAGYPESSNLPPENVGLELARACPDIDVIFAAHTHQDVAAETENGVACVQAGKWGERLAVAKLHLEKVDGHWKVVTKRTETVKVTDAPPDSEVLAAIRAAHEATLAYVHAPIARTTHAWSAANATVEDTPIIDLVNEVQREATGAQLSAAACFNTEAAFPAGQITIANVAKLYPYENILVAIRLSGKQLKAYLETSARFYAPYQSGPVRFDPDVRGYNYDMVSGVDYTIDRTKPVGSRIVSLSYQGQPVSDEQSFTMALNSYRATGGEGYDALRGAPVIYNNQESIRDLLIDYLKRKGTVEPEMVFHRNWSLLPADGAR